MTHRNNTRITEFILLGFAVRQELQYVLFLVFLVIYMTSLVGNIGMILLIKFDARLHTPMYFFLQNLAVADLFYTSSITPKTLLNFLVSDKSISFSGCVMQLYVYGIFVTSELYLLAAMAVDRYVAICNPLRYSVVMSQRVCIFLVTGSFLMGSLNATTNIGFLFSLSFCNSNIINHFFCDLPPILTLSCSNIYFNVMLLIIFVGFNLSSTLLVVFFSYIYILAAILRIPSATGRHKAFSTCASHFIAVTIFYGTLSYMYLQPSSSETEENDKLSSVFYGIVIPMLNPLIYSLRNKEVKEAVKVLLKRGS
ncbi:putative olfactory receptor 5AK3 [Monodelphis domestica]|uniref:putative olfactory receptor 5AK3 n=1 Tax=Monodelphis domestica TaxID=13616 RepID=UPI0024E250A2|nr:putative olfactory receptor 5AK3 [Monodelphis domestica]